ncbi:MAG: hypothetical protein KF856_01415 [Cyclobacteriaceae bacterium]|nr:hypothetical protein [Cyclobacteriaceae bacterium]
MRFAKGIVAVGLVILFNNMQAQQMLGQRSEIGFGLGTFNYTGDIVRTYNLAFSKPAATVFYRSNISRVISFRTAITGGKIGASDTRKPIDRFAANRAASFNLFLLEGSGTFEYHFLDWRDDKRRLRFTPYLYAGVALFGFSGVQQKNAEYSTIQMSIPFGGGMKYVLNPKYYIAFEFGIRKTFFDYLDNISDGDLQYKNYQYGNAFDTDNYFFAGFTLTYTFYDIPCPSSPYR